jgi:hypothetical protein
VVAGKEARAGVDRDGLAAGVDEILIKLVF